MKAFLLTAATLLAFAGGIFAQNQPPDFRWEVGVNGGYSAITRPLGPAEGYQGTRTNIVGDLSVRLNYFANPNLMLNLDVGKRRWETFGDWQLTGLFGRKIGTRQISYLMAKEAINYSVGINYVIPFYTEYQTYNKSNLNFGVNVGLITTINDGSTGYTTIPAGTDPAYTYVSSYNYGMGIGYSFGIQLGYTYYIFPRLGINLDLGMRYANVGTNDVNYRAGNSRYYLLYFPETLGIRWRF